MSLAYIRWAQGFNEPDPRMLEAMGVVFGWDGTAFCQEYLAQAYDAGARNIRISCTHERSHTEVAFEDDGSDVLPEFDRTSRRILACAARRSVNTAAMLKASGMPGSVQTERGGAGFDGCAWHPLASKKDAGMRFVMRLSWESALLVELRLLRLIPPEGVEICVNGHPLPRRQRIARVTCEITGFFACGAGQFLPGAREVDVDCYEALGDHGRIFQCGFPTSCGSHGIDVDMPLRLLSLWDGPYGKMASRILDDLAEKVSSEHARRRQEGRAALLGVLRERVRCQEARAALLNVLSLRVLTAQRIAAYAAGLARRLLGFSVQVEAAWLPTTHWPVAYQPAPSGGKLTINLYRFAVPPPKGKLSPEMREPLVRALVRQIEPNRESRRYAETIGTFWGVLFDAEDLNIFVVE